MEHEPGDDYLRRIAGFIRTHEKNLAEAGFSRRRRNVRKPSPDMAPSLLNPLGWFGQTTSTPSAKPLVLSLDTHHLFYMLIRLEAIGINVGTLDVKADNPSRPMRFIHIPTDKSDTLSLSSIRSSFSAVSALSLGAGWWGRAEPPSLDLELKYIYSSFTKLPALSLTAPGRKSIAELANEPPNENAIPLDSFKNLQSLECLDIDPRTLLGWDRLAEGLRSLTVKRSGLEDISDLFIGAVIDDQARREGRIGQTRRRRISPDSMRLSSFYSTRLPDLVPEDDGPETPTRLTEPSSVQPLHTPGPDDENSEIPNPPPLSSLKWAFLKHLSLSDNALTFLPTTPLPYLTAVTHLDLSSNLLISVPPGLSALHNLISLNLSDNMIDSVLGIYTNLGQILQLNLSRNRLESICGLERLPALERVDLRSNRIDDSAEVGRLATLPNIAEVWVEGNPFVEYEDSYRITCFGYFWKEGKNIMLDGTAPGFYEKRNLAGPPAQHMTPSRPTSTVYSPPALAVKPSNAGPSSVSSFVPPTDDPSKSPKISPAASGNASPLLVGKARRKKNKRIVELDGEHSDGTGSVSGHSRMRSESVPRSTRDPKAADQGAVDTSTSVASPAVAIVTPAATRNMQVVRSPPRSRHSRHQSEFIPSPSSASPTASSALPALSSKLSSSPPSGSQVPNPQLVALSSRGSQTFSSRSAARRARVSASVFEPPEESGPEEFRKRIEALRTDMGDGWLKVFSQTQLGGVGAGAA